MIDTYGIPSRDTNPPPIDNANERAEVAQPTDNDSNAASEEAARPTQPGTRWQKSWPRQVRTQRQERKRVLLNRGVKPAKKQWMICVETTAIEIPTWARAKADPRLSQSSHKVWFRGRNSGRAKILERQDRQAGGRPELTTVECRLCSACGRLLLGLEAESRRKLDESGPLGRTLPCSGDCKPSKVV